jgi:hypothetical protein
MRAIPKTMAIYSVSIDAGPDRTGIHWPDVDEDISVRVLMGHPS